MGIYSNESIVSCATTKSTSPGIESAFLNRASRGGKTGVQAAIWCCVGGLEVAGLPLLVSVMLDEEVPGQVGVLGDLCVEGGNSVILVGALVITSLDQKRLVAGKGKAGSERTATYDRCERWFVFVEAHNIPAPLPTTTYSYPVSSTAFASEMDAAATTN